MTTKLKSSQNNKKTEVVTEPSISSEENKNILLLSKNETEEILKRVSETSSMLQDKRFDIMENHIKALHEQINVFIENEKQTQEFVVSLMTTVEEILHALEESGFFVNSDIGDMSKESDSMGTEGLQLNSDKKDDVASSSPTAKKYVNDSYMQNVLNSNKRKTELN